MKRLLMALLALTMVFALVGGALAEALVIAAEPGEASVPEVEFELVASDEAPVEEVAAEEAPEA